MNKTPMTPDEFKRINYKMKLPASPTPEQFKISEKKKNKSILLHFITEINNELNKGNRQIFRLPSDAYCGFMTDVKIHFEEYGWEAKLFGTGMSLRIIKDN